jgi:hypothetical protein
MKCVHQEMCGLIVAEKVECNGHKLIIDTLFIHTNLYATRRGGEKQVCFLYGIYVFTAPTNQPAREHAVLITGGVKGAVKYNIEVMRQLR